MCNQRPFPLWTTASVVLAFLGNLVAAAFLVLPLYQLVPGSSVRLLVEVLYSAVATLVTLVVVVGFSIVAWRKEGTRVVLALAVCLAPASFPISGWVMRHVAANRGIGLKS